MVVTPDENAVVFICSSKKGFRWISKISVGLIERAGDYRILEKISEEEPLDYHLEKPDSCEVVVSKVLIILFLVIHRPSSQSFKTLEQLGKSCLVSYFRGGLT